jgi:hypothetical protein
MTYKCSEETKRKLSLAQKGKKMSEEFKEKCKKNYKNNPKIGFKKGYIMTEEHRKNLINGRIGNTFGRGNKGKIVSQEVRKKLSKSNLGNISGRGNKGKPKSEEHRKSMSISHGGDGTPRTVYPLDWKNSLKESILIRDNYTCQVCGRNQNELNGRVKKLDVHHIDHNKNNLNPENLITLCKRCHPKTNSNREKWIEYLNTKVMKGGINDGTRN